MRNWPKRIEIYLSEEQLRYVKSQAEIAGLPLQKYMRKLLTNQEIKARPTKEYGAILRELSAIGNNINQIARVANSKGVIGQTELTEIQSMQQMIWQKVKAL